MKYLLLVSFLFSSYFICGQALAPSLLSAAGDAYHGNNIQLSWTIGGSILGSFENSDITLSTGVQSEESNPFVLGMTDYANAIVVYPNPVENLLSIQFEIVADYQIVISDLTGRMVFTETTSHTNQKIIDIGHLGIGAYALQILDANQRPIKKLKLSKIH